MNLLGCIYLVLVAFCIGHAIGWHRGRNHDEDRRP